MVGCFSLLRPHALNVFRQHTPFPLPCIPSPPICISASIKLDGSALVLLPAQEGCGPIALHRPLPEIYLLTLALIGLARLFVFRATIVQPHHAMSEL